MIESLKIIITTTFNFPFSIFNLRFAPLYVLGSEDGECVGLPQQARAARRRVLYVRNCETLEHVVARRRAIRPKNYSRAFKLAFISTDVIFLLKQRVTTKVKRSTKTGEMSQTYQETEASEPKPITLKTMLMSRVAAP